MACFGRTWVASGRADASENEWKSEREMKASKENRYEDETECVI